MSDPAIRMRLDQRRQALQDIADVEAQLDSGELDDKTAAGLVARYRAEIANLDEVTPQADRPPIASSRRVVGTLLLVGAFVVVSILAFAAVRPRDEIPGSSGGVDLNSVTNDQMEAVIQANLDIPEAAAMRIALADRYFDEAEFSDALPHYLAALDGQLDTTRQARALARIGWMSAVSGRLDVAEAYLAQAMQADPGYTESHLFLGFVLFNAGDPQGALDELEPLMADENLPDSLRAQLTSTIDAARAQLESGAP